MMDIKKYCDNLSLSISNELKLSESEKEVIAYGLFAFCQVFFAIIVTYFVGLLIGVPLEALVITLSITILRKSSGGIHASTPGRCIFVSVVVGVFLGLLSTLLPSGMSFTVILGVFTFLCVYILIFKFAPKDSPNKPIKNILKRQRLRKISLLTVLVFNIISIILIIIHYKFNASMSSFIYSIYFGLVWQSFTLTNVAKKILIKIV